jgi:hypothetical protein
MDLEIPGIPFFVGAKQASSASPASDLSAKRAKQVKSLLRPYMKSVQILLSGFADGGKFPTGDNVHTATPP